ncbi:hypothetical protein HAX54_002841, partial [Datura stramonium]|nr:hypothetical protein [Datura stramonium]
QKEATGDKERAVTSDRGVVEIDKYKEEAKSYTYPPTKGEAVIVVAETNLPQNLVEHIVNSLPMGLPTEEKDKAWWLLNPRGYSGLVENRGDCKIQKKVIGGEWESPWGVSMIVRKLMEYKRRGAIQILHIKREGNQGKKATQHKQAIDFSTQNKAQEGMCGINLFEIQSARRNILEVSTDKYNEYVLRIATDFPD